MTRLNRTFIDRIKTLFASPFISIINIVIQLTLLSNENLHRFIFFYFLFKVIKNAQKDLTSGDQQLGCDFHCLLWEAIIFLERLTT